MNQIVHYQTGYSLAYAEYGDPHGFPILVQHGLIASIEDGGLFRRLVEAGRRVICIARPGYGDSSPYVMKNLAEWGEIVGALVAELHLDRFDILGTSSGAPYSYAIGRRFPQQARAIYVLSGIPALYDAQVLAHWPYPFKREASLPELQTLARRLFFADLKPGDLEQADLRDSLRNDCFGVAQDLRLRFIDWGFSLSEVFQPVSMRHSRADTSVPLITAELTSRLLPHCRLEIHENDPHFSPVILDDFLRAMILA